MPDRVEQIRTRHWVLAFAAFFLAVAIPGLIFWNTFGQHVSRCVYGDPTCSLTVSTYLLCCLTVLAFLAAYKAARYAQKTLQMEREVILSLNRCLAPGSDEPKDERYWRQRGVKFDHRPFREEQRYLRVVDEGFQDNAPEKFTRTTYVPIDFDCLSLGRSPLINGRLKLTATAPKGSPRSLHLDIGSIPSDQYVHIKLWLQKDLTDVQFEWAARATHREGSASPQEVEANPHQRKFGMLVGAGPDAGGPALPNEGELPGIVPE